MKRINNNIFLILLILLYYYSTKTIIISGQRLAPPREYQSSNGDDNDDEKNEIRQKQQQWLHQQQEEFDDNYDENDTITYTDKGAYLGAPCDYICSARLLHVYCNPVSGLCECEKNYPVRLNPNTGCGRPKRLGEQCYYQEACQYTDQHSACIQVHHNAICQCDVGYHSVSIQKPSKRVFCAEDLVVMTTDFSTFAGVLSGIAILSGLICFVLRLFNQNMYGGGGGGGRGGGRSGRRHRFGNANLAPPILFSSDPGSLPMPIIDRSLLTSRTSSHRTISSLPVSRRASTSTNTAQGCRAFAVSASRAGAARTAAILLLSYQNTTISSTSTINHNNSTKFGSRRPSLTSVHSGGSSSIRSYSARRYEREREQKEEREMQRRLARMTASMNSCSGSTVVGGGGGGRVPATPSPHSTDDLLPTLEEDKQVPPLAIQEESSQSFHEDIPSTSKQFS